MTDSSVKYDGAVRSISTTLLRGVQANDQAAWHRLVDLYTPLVFYWCNRARLSSEQCRDVGQEVFVAVACSIGDFHRDKSSDTFRGWLRTITRNKIHDFWRKQQKEPRPRGGSTARQLIQNVPDNELGDEHYSEETAILARQMIELIRSQFSEKDWQAFSAVVMHGHATGDVAAELNITPNMVYLAKSRIIARLKADFGNEAEDLFD